MNGPVRDWKRISSGRQTIISFRSCHSGDKLYDIRRIMHGKSRSLNSEKISTTVSSATLAYLEQLIEKGAARSLADAIDSVVQRLLVYENRERLANDTAAYFDGLSPEAMEEENQFAAALSSGVKGIDFDREP